MKKKDNSYEPSNKGKGGNVFVPTHNSTNDSIQGKGGNVNTPTYNGTKANREMRTPGKGMMMSKGEGSSKMGGSKQKLNKPRESNPPPKRSNGILGLGGNSTSTKLMDGLVDGIVKALTRAVNVTEGEEHDLLGSHNHAGNNSLTNHNRTDHNDDSAEGENTSHLISFWEMLQSWMKNKSSSGMFNQTNGLGNYRYHRNNTSTNRTALNRSNHSNDERDEDAPLAVSFWSKIRGWWMNTTAPGSFKRTDGVGNHHHDRNETSTNYSSVESHRNRTAHNGTGHGGTSFWDKLHGWMMNATGTSNGTNVAENHHHYWNNTSTNHSFWGNRKNRTAHNQTKHGNDDEEHDLIGSHNHHEWNNTSMNHSDVEDHKNGTDDGEGDHDLPEHYDHHEWNNTSMNHSDVENHKNRTTSYGTDHEDAEHEDDNLHYE
jgi:hypothetical protein